MVLGYFFGFKVFLMDWQIIVDSVDLLDSDDRNSQQGFDHRVVLAGFTHKVPECLAGYLHPSVDPLSLESRFVLLNLSFKQNRVCRINQVNLQIRVAFLERTTTSSLLAT